MTASLFTTAVLSGDLLCSSVPMPTDGLPEWMTCPECKRRCGDGMSDESYDDLYDPCPVTGKLHPSLPWSRFPVTVGVVDPNGLDRHDETGTWVGTADAVTTLVEVTGPSHHAEDCTYSPGDPMGNYAGPLCHPDAAPDGWHTPVRVVERLDTPEPVDVPTELRCVHCHRAPDAAPTIHADARCSAKSTGHDTWRVPAVWWVPA